MTGNIKKGTGYKETLLENIEPDHPINHGILMQIHHLISAKAVKLSKTGPFLVSSGYDISTISNLVALPSTLQGACHLEVQLHRGDHRHRLIPEDDDDDKNHPIEYHLFISNRLKRLIHELKKHCGKDDEEITEEVNNKMNAFSEIILDKISSFKLPLTRIYKSFEHGKEGCKCVESIPDHFELDSQCVSRDHIEEKHGFSSSSKDTTITFKKCNYELRVGN